MRALAGASLLTLAVAASGCATTGIASGELIETTGKQTPVTFHWKSDRLDPTGGRIWGDMPDGGMYDGRYYEIKKTMAVTRLGPLWSDWVVGWTDWPVPRDVTEPLDDDTPPDVAFVKEYTGKVVAQLKSPDGKTAMRCRFTLDQPTQGLAGGGNGECTANNGDRVAYAVLTPGA
jgi:hypothetical protein